MSAVAEDKKIVVGGSFLIEERTPEEVFTPEDFTEEHRMIAETARQFMDNEVRPRLDELEKTKNWSIARELVVKGAELGFDLSRDKELVTRVTARVKSMESRGYTFEAADASFELLLVEEAEGARPAYFDVESWRVITDSKPTEEAVSEATVKLRAGGARIVTIGEGNGPVNALDAALREAIGQAFPEVAKFELIDYKVRILDQGHGTDATTRVLIETSDGQSTWVTVGVGHNVIEASWEALVDGVTFGLRRQGERPQ